jgi:hypothetical protein
VLSKHSINQNQPAIKNHGGRSGAFTYITAQIVKERSVSFSKDRKQQMNLPLLISGFGVGGASRDRTGDP